MKKRYMYCLLALILSAAIWAGSATLPVSAFEGSDLNSAIAGIIKWKKSDVGSASNGYLINDNFLSQAGTTPGDWYPIGLGRLGIADNQAGYLAVLNDNITTRCQKPEKLDKAKATEWHRISLAILASGGNPRRAGNSGDIDLIADGTYNRVDAQGAGILGRQGINGFIWGLIALDSMCYEVPQNAYYTRDDIILNILNRQLSDGGWALSGEVSDPDITAMSIQALAPYYNSEKEYTFENSKGITETVKVRNAVEGALKFLSAAQLDGGDFKSWGTENCESGAQVAVALCSLGIDLFSDSRFITEKGKTVYDGIIKYRNSDGGFLHSYTYDSENPSAAPEKSNTMAGEQALLALAAISRRINGQRRLYDFRPDQSSELKAHIAEVEKDINGLGFTSSSSEIQSVYDEYLEIEGSERSYVKNYSKLSEILAFAGIPYADESIDYNSGDAGVITPIEEFTSVDIEAVNALPGKLTTACRAEVLRLWSKIQNCFDFEGKQTYYIKLEKAKNEIEAIQHELEDIKAEIKKKLYPFDKISLSDRKTVYELYSRYMALSEYDRTQFEQSDIEGLLKSKTQVDNLYLAVWISSGCAVVAGVLIAFTVLHVRKRKKNKALKLMQESDE